MVWLVNIHLEKSSTKMWLWFEFTTYLWLWNDIDVQIAGFFFTQFLAKSFNLFQRGFVFSCEYRWTVQATFEVHLDLTNILTDFTACLPLWCMLKWVHDCNSWWSIVETKLEWNSLNHAAIKGWYLVALSERGLRISSVHIGVSLSCIQISSLHFFSLLCFINFCNFKMKSIK